MSTSAVGSNRRNYILTQSHRYLHISLNNLDSAFSLRLQSFVDDLVADFSLQDIICNFYLFSRTCLRKKCNNVMFLLSIEF